MSVALTDIPVAQEVGDKLQALIGPTKFKLWFHSARVKLTDHSLCVEAANRFNAEWIGKNFQAELAAVAEQELGPGAQVQVKVRGHGGAVPARPAERGAAGPIAARAAAAPPRPKPLPADAASKPLLRYSLEDFVVGPSNELVYNTVGRMADGDDKSLRVLFVHGGCGLGKTHLLQGLCRRFVQKQPSARWAYSTAEQFTNQYIQAVRHNGMGEFRRRMRRLDLLVVDDVHFLSAKTATQTEFLHTFNAIDLCGARIVLASDAHPKLIQEMADALTSRFMCGLVVRVESPDFQTRVRLIQALAQRRGMRLLDSVVQEMARQHTGSVREIEGMLTKLAALAAVCSELNEGGGTIGHALLQRFWQSEAASIHTRPVRIEQIIRAVCQELNVERVQLSGPGRHRRVVLARSTIIHLARQMTTLSYPELAKALGRPNHSSIVTAAQRIARQALCKEPLTPADTDLAPTIDQLIEHLRRAVARCHA